MDPGHVQTLLLKLLDLPPRDREKFLEAECSDPGLRTELEALLAREDAVDAMLRTGPGAGETRSVAPGGTAESPLDTVSSPPPGTAVRSGALPQIPNYRLHRKIGGGGFGEVWLAEQVFGDGAGVRHCAVKLLSRSALTATEIAGVRSYLGRLPRGESHLNQILHVGEVSDYVYYAVELADGYSSDALPSPSETYSPRTLAEDLRRRGALSLTEAVERLDEVLRGLETLHSVDLLHRDLKPANVVVVKGEAALTDFGLVTRRTERETSAGTPLYAPPGGVQDPAGDLYCAGKLLYELVLGEPPWKTPEVPDSADEATRANYEAVRPIVERACHPDADRRFRTCGEMRRALSGLLPTSPPRPTASHRPGLLAASVLTLAAAIVAGALLLRPSPGPLTGASDVLWWEPGQAESLPIARAPAGLRTGDSFELIVELEEPCFPLVAAVAREHGAATSLVEVLFPPSDGLREQKPRKRIPRESLRLELTPPRGAILLVTLASRRPVTRADIDRVKAALEGLSSRPVDRLLTLWPPDVPRRDRGFKKIEAPADSPIARLGTTDWGGLELIDGIAFPQRARGD